MTTTHALEYLAAPVAHPAAAGIVALFGDEPFLKQLALKTLRREILGDEQDVPYARLEGKTTAWRDVHDELSTVSLFSNGPRLVIVEEADKFVSTFRDKLENYNTSPAGGVLVLIVDQWPGNTRLAKAVAKTGLGIECRVPQTQRGKTKVIDEKRLLKWISQWAKQSHNIKLPLAAAEDLLDLVGPELGLIDSELAKLALYVEPGGTVTDELVRDIAGGWRTKSIWDLVDAAAAGKADEAMAGIDRLLHMGEAPQALFGQIAWSLRRFAAATRIYQQSERSRYPLTLGKALEQAGFRHWQLKEAQSQLRQIGRHRAGELYRWLLDADLALKGSHSHPARARAKLEHLLVRLSTAARNVDVATYA